jgi:hypothetical protein
MPEAAPFPYQTWMDDLRTPDKERQNAAFAALEAATQAEVAWAYAVWNELLRLLRGGDNRQRAIAAQVLCNLAKSDPEGRMERDAAALLAVTKDERYVTARHCLQNLWKVALAGERQRVVVIAGLTQRFHECETEKNGTLTRYDIQVVLRRIYDAAPDPALRVASLALIDQEADPKYRKKYAAIWRT